MSAVLGIDAAWTPHNPSGIALAVRETPGWRLCLAASSYAEFVSGACDRPTGGRVEVAKLLDVCRQATGSDPAIVAIDMPMAVEPVTGRRTSDNAISTAFGAMKCSTHSPSAERPGAVSTEMVSAFRTAGYNLALAAPVGDRSLIEVYPHPALVRLCRAAERLPYKAAKAGAYWPNRNRSERRAALRDVWARIVGNLDTELNGAAELLAPPDPGVPAWTLKAYEDKLDAAVCCWVGACVLDGGAKAYGDAVSAIWVPKTWRGDTIFLDSG